MKIKTSKHLPTGPNIRLVDPKEIKSKNTSAWKLLAAFTIVNLMLIIIVNFWQPVNHTDLKSFYDKRQDILVSAYELQQYFNEFQSSHDQNAFSIIHKTVNLTTTVNKIGDLKDSGISDSAVKLNASIEKIVDNIPTIKLLQQNAEKISRSIKNSKAQIFNTMSDVKQGTRKNLYNALDKMEGLVQKLKFGQTIDTNLVDDYQQSLEDLGFDIEQFSNNVTSDSADNEAENVMNTVTTIYEELSSFVPAVTTLAETYEQVAVAKSAQNNIIEAIKVDQSNYSETIDDKMIIMGIIIIANLLLLSIISVTQLFKKTSTAISTYKNKKNIFYLTHMTEQPNVQALLETPVSEIQPETPHDVVQLGPWIDLTTLNELKQRIVNDCYILQNNLDKIEKFYMTNHQHINDEHKIPAHILLILYKVSNTILDSAVLLDKKINFGKGEQPADQVSASESSPLHQPEVTC